MESIENYSELLAKDLTIDKYKLDEECLSHATRYAFYAEASVEAKTNVSKAIDEMKMTIAEANLRVRKSYADNGIKVTEALVTSAVESDGLVLKAKDNVRQAEAIFSTINVAVQCMEARKSELDNLVKLYCAGYFSNVSGANVAKESSQEITSSAIRKSLNTKEVE